MNKRLNDETGVGQKLPQEVEHLGGFTQSLERVDKYRLAILIDPEFDTACD